MALLLAACSSSPSTSGTTTSSAAVSGTSGTHASGQSGQGLAHIGGSVSIWAEWTSTEQNSFEAVLQPFESQTGITVNYAGKGSNMDTALEAAVQGGAPPDVALVPDPGTLKTLATAGNIQDLGPIVGSTVAMDYSPAWTQLATVNGKLYGVWFKGANKNTIWYNPAEFAAAGIKTTPTTWEQLISDAGTLKAAGITPFSLCTDVGWPVADFWQNLYLKTAGATSYDNLATHKIKWTDPSVTKAFHYLSQLVGQPSYLLGGTQGALASTYPECVDQVFPKPGSSPKAAMIVEGDFVVSEIIGNSANYNAGTTGTGGATCTTDPSKTPCYDFFPFPAPSGDSANDSVIQGAGDVAMLMHNTAQSVALIKYLASPASASIWAHLGGFASPNKGVSPSVYPDPVSKADAVALQHATGFVFSLDDLQGSWEKSMWSDMLNFVKTPTVANVTSIQATMESQATAAGIH
jgi:hypothetical protein